MSSEANLKTCLECRAEVIAAADSCPECGYPFNDTHTVRCKSCNNMVVDDNTSCPVCGQLLEITPAVSLPDHSEQPDVQDVQEQPDVPEQLYEQRRPSMPTMDVQLDVSPQFQESGLVAGNNDVDLNIKIEIIKRAIQDLANVMQANNKVNDDITSQIIESNRALQKRIQEYQLENQNALQQSVDLAKKLYESQRAAADGATASLNQVSSELKLALVEIASQQASGTNTIVIAINDNAAKAAKQAPGGLPASVLWLDYIFIAVIAILVFSVVNMMVVAYLARLIMSD